MSLWAVCGVTLSLGTAAFAIWRAAGGTANYYAGGVYGMTRRSHAGYALAGFTLAASFLLSLLWPAIPVIALLAAAVLLAIFYFTSFLRGFSDEE